MVTLSGKVSTDVTIGYATADGTALAGKDYTAAGSGAALVIEAGDTTGMITLDTLDDTLEEAGETFMVMLSDSALPSNVALGRATAITTIQDADDTLMVGVEVPENVAEGSAAVFTVKLTGGTGSEDVVVTYEVRGPTPEVDYEVPPGTAVVGNDNTVRGKLVIPAGATSGTITLQTIADNDTGNDQDDLDEELTLTLSAPDTMAGEVALVSDPAATTTMIKKSDTVTVSVADTTVVEGNRARFRVTLSGPVANATTVTYNTSAPTTPPDFDQVTDGSITIAASRTTGTFTVETKEDDLAENDESFSVTLEPLPGVSTNVRNLALGRATATATITDDDPLTVSVVSDQINAIEAGVKNATFTVSLSGGSGSTTVTVDYTVSGTATAGEDYEVPSDGTPIDAGYTDTVDIDPGTRQVQIEIPTIGDALLEVDETLIVTLTHVDSDAGIVAVGTPKVATATVGPSNPGVTVSVGSPTGPPVTEGGEAIFPVTLAGGTVAVDVRLVTPRSTAPRPRRTTVRGRAER